MAIKNYLDLTGLSLYDAKIKAFVEGKIAEGDASAFKAVNLENGVLKFYRVDPITDGASAAYEVTLPVQDLSHLMELVEGATKGNVATFGDNGQVVDSGIVATDLALKSEVEEVDAKADKNAEDIAAINDAETGILKQAKDYADGKDEAIAAAQAAADAAQADADELEGRMDVVEGHVGTMDNLETTAKADLVTAINEVRNAVSVGGTAAAITIDTTSTTEGYLKSYTIKQGENVVGTIDIPKELMAVSGQVVENPEGMAEGTYLELTIQNGDPVYVDVASLIDNYTAAAGATQVQVAINAETREVSATLVAGGVGTTELADNAVTTVKIADNNVTKAKLSVELQGSIDKADASASQEALDEEIERAKAAEAQALTDAKGYTDEKMTAEVTARDEAIAQAKGEAITEAGTNADTKDAEILRQAKEYADSKVDGVDLSGIATNAEAIANLQQTHGTDKAALEASISTAQEAAEAAQEAADKAQGDIDSFKGTYATDKAALEAADAGLGERVTALEEKVGEGFQAITAEEINNLFPTA